MEDGERPGQKRRYGASDARGRSADAIAARRERRQRFRELAQRAIDELPAHFREAVSNLDIVLASRPTAAELRTAGLGPGQTLLGLYEGIPLTRRDSGYAMVMPDKITLYQDVIEEACPDDASLVEQVRTTLLHELAHHFGIDDDRLDELGMS